MNYYKKHVFLCTNQKPPGKPCCANSGGDEFFAYMKAKLVELDLFGSDKIRISKSGCLGRCKLGPCLVVYPESIWYSYSSFADLDTIITEHLIADRPVETLQIIE